VTAAARPSREELLQRAEADPLSVQAYKRIDEIREGDLVVALDENSGELVARPVTRLFRNTSDHLREVTYRTADGAERKLEATDEHPFWTARGGWTPAKELQPGDVFRQANGDAATLLATLYIEEPDGVAVYNFEVDGAHNYFVASPNTIRGPPERLFADPIIGDALLVHNQCAKPTHTIQDAVRLGREGERKSRILKTYARIDSITGTAAYRIPDSLLRRQRLLIEVKNVSQLRFTRQLRDYLYFSMSERFKFILRTHATTSIHPELQRLINLKYITHITF